MSTDTATVGTVGYVPPKQSRRGQVFDSVFILALLFAVLFGVTYYSNSAATPSTSTVQPLAKLPITQVEREQYPISPLALVVTFGVIGAYLVFVYVMSFREYREVIRERFGPAPGSGPDPTTSPTQGGAA